MPTHLPLATVIEQVLARTPAWVWVLLLAITALGLKQLSDRVVTSRRMTIAPVAFVVLSVWSATSKFGVTVPVLSMWLVGFSLAIGARLQFAAPSTASYQGNGRFAVQGSAWPLLGMWAIFVTRYVTTVALIMNPSLHSTSWFTTSMPLAFGALSGLFVARAIRVLRTASSEPSLGFA